MPAETPKVTTAEQDPVKPTSAAKPYAFAVPSDFVKRDSSSSKFAGGSSNKFSNYASIGVTSGDAIISGVDSKPSDLSLKFDP